MQPPGRQSHFVVASVCCGDEHAAADASQQCSCRCVMNAPQGWHKLRAADVELGLVCGSRIVYGLQFFCMAVGWGLLDGASLLLQGQCLEEVGRYVHA